MKNILLILAIILSSLNFVKSQVVISNDIYTVIYSEALQQPLMLSYEVAGPNTLKYMRPYGLNPLCNVNESGFSRVIYRYQKITLNQKETIPTSCSYAHNIFTSDNKDYKDNDYDKGHLAPYATFEEKELDCVLNDFLNIALMNSSLNKGVWRTLEERERNFDQDVSVTISLSFEKSQRVLGGATIPSGFTKILSYYSDEKFIEEIYSFPNNSSVLGKKLSDYKIN